MTIHYNVTAHVATVTLDRPESLNALDLDSLNALRAALAQARDDDDVRVIVLTGAGQKSFCVGADLKNTLPPATGSLKLWSARWPRITPILLLLPAILLTGELFQNEPHSIILR